MKHTFLTLALGLALVACSKPENEQAATKNGSAQLAASMQQIDIKVPTIQCNSCVAHVEDALSAVDGVSAVKIDLKTKIAQASFDPAKTSLAAIEKAISLAGYDANETKSDSSAYAALDACCKVPGSHDSN
jgi:copper ion binding protein